LRNWVTTGNPIFPVAAALGPVRLPGWPDVSPWQAALDPENAVHPWSFVWNRTDLWGPLFRFTMLPAAVVAPIVAMVRLRRRGVVVVAAMLLPALFYAEFLWLVADHREVRYLLAAIALLAVSATWLVSRLGAPWRTAMVMLLAAAAAMRWAIPHPGVALIAAVVGATLVIAVRLAKSEPRRIVAIGATAAVVVFVATAGAVVRRYEERRLSALPAAHAFAELSGGRAVRVAYVGWNQPYLFCGERQRNVLLMPPLVEIDDPFAPMLYRWREPVSSWVPADPRRAWLRLLKKEGIEWVVVVTRAGAAGVERGWIAGSPDRFARAYADATTEIWQVRR
jgi:hypothetical protein